jgi:hypothetical protein
MPLFVQKAPFQFLTYSCYTAHTFKPWVKKIATQLLEGQKWEELPIPSVPLTQFSQFATCFSRFLYQYWGFCLCDCGSKQDRVQCWIRKWIQNCSITGLQQENSSFPIPNQQCSNYGNANFLYTRQLDLYLNTTITTSDDHRSNRSRHNLHLAVLLTTEMPVFSVLDSLIFTSIRQ